ncbi:MAG: NAD(P)/FAD-dependent oxidoreductase [Chitinophagales bacterium]
MKIAIIGGGAAGFFSAIAAKTNHPKAEVILFEKTQKLLAKVRISGGGRCNVTNASTSIKQLSEAYPRGGKAMKKALRIFSTPNTREWFESRGVRLYAQDDNRVFPVSDSSQSIIDCLMSETRKLGVSIQTGSRIEAIEAQANEQLILHFFKTHHPSQIFDKVIVASGGSPKKSGLDWLEKLGHKIEKPVPSLFTFNMPSEKITQLMGVVAENTLVRIQGSKLQSQGSLLITHWGMSGPAILKLSAFGARLLSESAYRFKVQVNWTGVVNQEEVKKDIEDAIEVHPKKKLSNVRLFGLPERLWLFLLQKSDLQPNKRWLDLGKKNIHKLVTVLTHDVYDVSGKTTFKEEFVTCGGVSLKSINVSTMESKVCKNLYFAGEVMDIDGITGGYNFQAAWTTGFIAGKLG